MSEIIVLSGHIIVPEDELEKINAALQLHIQLTRAEQGCLVFEVNQSASVPTRFDVYEEFVDQAAFDIHQKRVADSDWGRVSQNVDRHYSLKTR